MNSYVGARGSLSLAKVVFQRQKKTKASEHRPQRRPIAGWEVTGINSQQSHLCRPGEQYLQCVDNSAENHGSCTCEAEHTDIVQISKSLNSTECLPDFSVGSKTAPTNTAKEIPWIHLHFADKTSVQCPATLSRQSCHFYEIDNLVVNRWAIGFSCHALYMLTCDE